ncbi:hypothetical protein Zmor_006293 [Zophobas morio]|uniref:Uncharacterized protein n=1 Tax=Zophobas morio TaxID=2755281 RepID=A0AA38IPR8_9CUCU|nr:hypothetical protein Zmor_006293 [Zophobas morio]
MEIPEEIRKKALSVVQNLLPDISKELYDREYQPFKQWMRDRSTDVVCEEVLLAYFADQVKAESHLPYGPNTLG